MRKRITYANVAATLALFLALGGSAYAVSVNGADVVNGSLTGKDIKNNSIKPRDVAGLGANVISRPGTPATGGITATATASCNQGETLISGGYTISGNSTPAVIQNAGIPTAGTPTTWRVIAIAVNGTPSSTIEIDPYAICAS
jgi:hypothetical protein